MGSAVLRDTMLAGHHTVSGGIYVDAEARDGARSGDTVTGAASTETVHVRVQAASWIAAASLRVFVDGVETGNIPLDDTTADPLEPTVRFDGDLEVDVAPAGSWVVFVAASDEALEPVHPGRLPFGVTNPIFFER